MSGFAHEYNCGCIIHGVAGTIRKCPGLTSRSMSGREVAKPDNAEQKHNKAMTGEPVRTFDVADILP